MSAIPTTIDGSSGGLIHDQPGLVVIDMNETDQAATVVASQGTDTILGGHADLLVKAAGNANPLQVQPGYGAVTVNSGTGALTIVGTDGSASVVFEFPAGTQYRTSTDFMTLVTMVSDGSGADTVLGGSLVYTIPGATWEQPPPDTTGGGGDTTGGGGGDTTGGGGGGDTTGGGGSGTPPNPLGGTAGSPFHDLAEARFTTLLGGPWDTFWNTIVTFGPGGAPASGPIGGVPGGGAGDGGSGGGGSGGGRPRGHASQPPPQPAAQPAPPPSASAGTPPDMLVIPDPVTGNVTVPAGTEFVRNDSQAPVTLSGGADAFVINAGGDMALTVAGGTYVDAQQLASPDPVLGHARISVTGNGLVIAGAGNDTVYTGAGNATVDGGGGANLFVLGSGASLVHAQGQDTVRMGSGAATVTGADTVGVGADLLIQGGRGSLVFLNGAANATVTAGRGAVTVDGGQGGGSFAGGTSGNNLLIAGTGASTLIGGGAGDVLVTANAADNLLIAAARGNTTLDGAQASGDNLFQGGGGQVVVLTGTGNDTVSLGAGAATVVAGGGDDLIAAGTRGLTAILGSGNETVQAGAGVDRLVFVNGTSAGSDLITGFSTSRDKIVLQGYGADEKAAVLASQQQVAGGVAITLSDGTQVTLAGVSVLTARNIQLG